VPSTPSHSGLPRHRPHRQARPVGGGTVEVGGEAAVESAESTEVEDMGWVEVAPPGRGRGHHRRDEVVTVGTRSRSSRPGQGKARGHSSRLRSHHRTTVEVVPPGRGLGHAAGPRPTSCRWAKVGRATLTRSRSHHSTEVDWAIVQVPHARQGGGASSTTGRCYHHTAMLVGARRRRAGLLLHGEAHRAFHHWALGHSGGMPE
jgi:hypothetical protein